MENPYETPQASNEDQPQVSMPFLTRQRVFWLGLGGIVSALMMVTGSQALFVESRRQSDVWDTIVVVIDVAAAFLFFGGMIALAVYLWFPDLTMKRSWRRKQSDK